MNHINPCKCGGDGVFRDLRLQFAITCNSCRKTAYSESYFYLDFVGDDADTDEESDSISQKEVDKIDWESLEESVINLWNRINSEADKQ